AHLQDPSALDYLGLAHYRAGRSEEAGRCLRQSLEARREEEARALTWATLALVHLRQGQPEEAKSWLAKVDDWLAVQSKAFPPPTGIAPPDWDWQGLLEIRQLRREAEMLVPKAGEGKG